MRPIRVSNDEVQSLVGDIIIAGHYKLDTMLLFATDGPLYYTSIVYKSKDKIICEKEQSRVYVFDNIAIATDNAPYATIHPKFDFMSKYEIEAGNIMDNKNPMPFPEKVEKVTALLRDFIKKALEAHERKKLIAVGS